MAKFGKQSAEVTSPGFGKVPTVTRILLEGPTVPKAQLPEYAWISKICPGDREKLKAIAQLVMNSGAGIITIQKSGKGYELGLRPRVSGDSSRYAVQVAMDGNLKPVKDALKAIGCCPARTSETTAATRGRAPTGELAA